MSIRNIWTTHKKALIVQCKTGYFTHFFFIVHSNMLILYYVLQIIICYIEKLLVNIARVKDHFLSSLFKKPYFLATNLWQPRVYECIRNNCHSVFANRPFTKWCTDRSPHSALLRTSRGAQRKTRITRNGHGHDTYISDHIFS